MKKNISQNITFPQIFSAVSEKVDFLQLSA